MSIEEKYLKETGEVLIRKYIKGSLLGEGKFSKCYEFLCSENQKVFAAKIVYKVNIIKSKIKQNLINEIKIFYLNYAKIKHWKNYSKKGNN